MSAVNALRREVGVNDVVVRDGGVNDIPYSLDRKVSFVCPYLCEKRLLFSRYNMKFVRILQLIKDHGLLFVLTAFQLHFVVFLGVGFQ